MALARLLYLELDRGGSVEIASVPLIGIDVNFEFCRRVFADQQVFEGDRALMRLDAECHEIAILHSVVGTVLRVDMNVTCSPDDSVS